VLDRRALLGIEARERIVGGGRLDFTGGGWGGNRHRQDW
jgi:hypothetical protein